MTPPVPRLSAGVLTADLTRLGAEVEVLMIKQLSHSEEAPDGKW
jgi:hypothetical protein